MLFGKKPYQKLRDVDDNPVPEDGLHIGMDKARRQEMKCVGDFVGHDSVTGIVATLAPRDEVGFLGQEVDELPLAFVSPLRTEDDDDLIVGIQRTVHDRQFAKKKRVCLRFDAMSRS